KYQRHIEEMLVSPMPNYIILLGFVSGGVARGMAVGISVTLVSAIFTHLSIHSWLVLGAILLLTSFVFSLCGLINAVYANSFDDISIIPTFVLTPLTYLGGVFYSIELLGEFWQTASLVNPILYMVNAFRYGMLGITDISLTNAFGISALFLIILYFWALVLLNRGTGIRQ
ncbi:MAG: ABC transporter permease, partial [Gammaproteobacteria bacterium]|nr:ABC transporter permease [Gammaproteobacteria bacterium]